MALTAGCGPEKTVVSSTPAPSATAVVSGASVIMPEASLPPLPGVMAGRSPHIPAPKDDGAPQYDKQLTP